MNSTALTFLLLLFGISTFFIKSAHGDYEKTCTTEEIYGSPRGVCGPILADLLRFVCKGQYNKRSQDDSVDGSKVDGKGALTGTAAGAGVFLPKTSALTFLHDKRSSIRGIVCECCANQCTYGEMRQYCRAMHE